MELKKIRSNTLFSLFFKQLLWLSAGVFIEIIIFVLLFYLGLSIGFILPADYSQNYLVQNKALISESEPFDKTLIPHTCKYGLFDFGGNYLSGDLKKAAVEDAKAFIKDSYSGDRRFFLINTENGYCIVNYDMSAHFASYTLDKVFPKLEVILLVLFAIIFMLIVTDCAFRFERKLKKELKPVLYEISQIQNREINLVHNNSRIKEFNDILLSLYDMKIALSQSLKKEWETEQRRKSNISAIAHDIKTPLTIIKGNSELILEEDKIADIYQFAEIINNNSDKIERYIKLLIDETKNDLTEDSAEKTNINTIITDILNQSKELCKTKGIELIISNMELDAEADVNKDLIERAVINLVRNAIEHTTFEKKIKINLKGVEKCFIVEVEDYGKGFSDEALKYAKNQFYTERTERNEEHYGIGMYFANMVAEKYNGSLSYYNKPNQTGSVVVFEIKF